MKKSLLSLSFVRVPRLLPLFLSAPFAAGLLTGCADGAGGGAKTAVTPTTAAQTPAAAYLGSLSGSTVSAYPMDSNGNVSTTPLVQTATDGQGSFSLPRLPLMVEVQGGSYKEESTGNFEAFTGDTLRAAYLDAPTAVTVSPFTESIVVDAQANGGLNAGNLADATSRVSSFLNGVDPLTTLPSSVAPGATVTKPTDGNWLAFALGVESEMRTRYKIDHASAVQAIVGQAENGDTMLTCNGGAGNLALDGTLAAPQGDNCAFTMAAAHYINNPLNTSGVTALPVVEPTLASPTQYATVSANSCSDRVAILRDNLDLFDGRKDDVQAQLIDSAKNPITLANWSTTGNAGKWGPSKSVYGAITAPASCTDADAFRRELVLAVENYWIDHGLNYCHHHIPGWLPPDDSAKKKPKYRNSSSGSTSGGGDNGMTCTAQRSVTGAQQSSVNTSFATKDIQWQGADCSNFTAWTYDFAGVATGELPGDIASQACSVDATMPGKLLAINSKNILAMIGYLQTGDLLLVTQKSAVSNEDSYLDRSERKDTVYKEAHVVTWTGKRWSDLQKGEDRDKYDLSKLGQPGSRLGGDLSKSYLGYDPSLLGSDDAHDPWMIIDSHFAGPAYRPFVPANPSLGITANWYAGHLSAVRRLIGTRELDDSNAPLNAYVMANIGLDSSGRLVMAAPIEGATVNSGDRLIFQTEGTGAGCQRVVTPVQ